jgi:AbrB family looped-hinge helix DNA binding protein
MRITSKGQVTIPLALRNRIGFLPDTEVEFIADNGGVRLVKSTLPSGDGKRVIERIRGRGTSRMTAAEIMKLTRS